MKLDDETKSYFNRTQAILGEISILIKPISKKQSFEIFVFFLFFFLFS
jgi:hypothetical protein